MFYGNVATSVFLQNLLFLKVIKLDRAHTQEENLFVYLTQTDIQSFANTYFLTTPFFSLTSENYFFYKSNVNMFIDLFDCAIIKTIKPMSSSLRTEPVYPHTLESYRHTQARTLVRSNCEFLHFFTLKLQSTVANWQLDNKME